MSRAPNNEQKIAIEHNGGVLLKAGAGSGKTFVLVEHIVFQTKQFIFNSVGELKFREVSELEVEIKKFYSKIVLMTFTNKAAGELSIRLKKRIEEEVENFKEGFAYNPWKIAQDVINYMTVGTIHGFCFKLIKQGLLSDVSPDVTIISKSEFDYNLERLFNDWLSLQDDDELLNIIRANSSSVISAMQGVFSDPSIRLSWESEAGFGSEIGDLFCNIEKLSKFADIFTEEVSLEVEEKQKKSKWFLFLEKFLELRSNKLKDEASFELYAAFFDEVGRMPPAPRKTTGLTDIIDYFAKIREFRKFYFDKNKENFQKFFQHESDLIQNWEMKLKEIFNFINEHYKELNGVTFSDLEYLALKGVRNKAIANKISQMYRYFIVDEFQDTSYVQFEILTKIIDGDFSRVFCVGDEKQAIYGFRGGELGVFWECEEQVERSLTLKNNYRSLPDVIKFNNNLFENLFKLGLDYEGQDLMNVEVVHQQVPEGVDFESKGKIQRIDIQVSLEEGEKVLTEDVNFLEAKNIFEYVCKHNERNICILYKNLKPSSYLIELFIKNNIGFTAQIKIPYEQEPIIGIFYTLLGLKLNKSDLSNKFSSLVINGYFQRLGIKTKDNLNELMDKFFKDIGFFGIKNSFNKFLFLLGASNSNSKNNISHIHNLIDTTVSLEELFLKLKESSQLKFSMDFQFGNEPERITLMTTHSSKGLEFEEIILAGLDTNASRVVNRDLFGKLPGSFRWYLASNKKKTLKTPMYLYEELLTKHKDFAESKRLFYVAGTRAQKNITWFKITNEDKSFSQKNSWGHGLEKWSVENEDSFEHIEIDSIKLSKIIENKESLNLSTPLFHKHDMGLCDKLKTPTQMVVVPELSVTRLASLAQCPHMFYLQNTLKLSDEFSQQFNLADIPSVQSEVQQLDLLGSTFKSSAQRGTRIHEMISYAILNNWVLPRDEFDGEDKSPASWALSELEKYRIDYNFISEEPLKFPFFGHIISGIPDLVLLSSNEAKIWDFKTGAPAKEKNEGYFFQLKCYALALYELSKLPLDKEIELSLCYVDTKDFQSFKVGYEQLRVELFEVWSKLDCPSEKNLEYCSGCSYKKLCHFNPDIVAP